MPSNLTKDEMKRLVIIKRIYIHATDLSYKLEPLSYASILLYHDAVELFIHFACEHLNINKSHNELSEYWEDFSREGKPLTQKEAMKRFFKARTNLKHFSILPHKTDLDGYRSSVTNFFLDNTQQLFGIEFSNISMASLIDDDLPRKYILEAEESFKNGDYDKALENTSIALIILLDKYNELRKERYGWYFVFPQKLSLINPQFTGGEVEKIITEYPHLYDFIQQTYSFAISVQQAINFMNMASVPQSLGIDNRSYYRFIHLVPPVTKLDENYVRTLPYISSNLLAPSDVQFCIDFVIECALTIQDFIVNER